MTKEFLTKDLHLAAYLNLKGLDIIRLDKRKIDSRVNEKNLYFFVFDGDKVAEQNLENRFWNTGDQIDIKAYITAMRYIRDRLHLERT